MKINTLEQKGPKDVLGSGSLTYTMSGEAFSSTKINLLSINSNIRGICLTYKDLSSLASPFTSLHGYKHVTIRKVPHCKSLSNLFSLHVNVTSTLTGLAINLN